MGVLLNNPTQLALQAIFLSVLATPFARVGAQQNVALTCNAAGFVVSFDTCLSTALNAYFELEGEEELACLPAGDLYNPYYTKQNNGISSTVLAQAAAAINKNRNYDGPDLLARQLVFPFFLASGNETACLAATAILNELLAESCGRDSLTKAVSCNVCKAGQYKQKDPLGKVVSCIAQPRCGKGEYITPATTTREKQTCRTCPENTFQPIKGFRFIACSLQPWCAANEFISSPSKVSKQTCTPCGSGTFWPERKHRNAKCAPDIFCQAGEFVATDRFELDGGKLRCSACPQITTSPVKKHQLSTCFIATPSGEEGVISFLPTAKMSMTSSVLSVAWSPDGSRLAGGSYGTDYVNHGNFLTGYVDDDDDPRDGHLVIWNTATWATMTTITAHKNDVSSVAWSPDGRALASGSADEDVGIWDANTFAPIVALKKHKEDVLSVAWSPDSSMLASGSGECCNTRQKIMIWNTKTWDRITTLTEHLRYVNSVAWSPDGSMLASGSSDNTVMIWNAKTWDLITTLTEHLRYVKSVAWSPDGSMLASGSDDNTVMIWNTKTWGHITTLEHTQDVNSVAWSPDGSMLASGSEDDTVMIWNTKTWGLITMLTEHTYDVNSAATVQNDDSYDTLWIPTDATVAWSPDGSMLASGSSGGSIIVWDVTISVCRQGEHLDESQTTCEPCPPDTYQSLELHNNVRCREQTTCGVYQSITVCLFLARIVSVVV